jgi:hypothetical protein
MECYIARAKRYATYPPLDAIGIVIGLIITVLSIPIFVQAMSLQQSSGVGSPLYTQALATGFVVFIIGLIIAGASVVLFGIGRIERSEKP